MPDSKNYTALIVDDAVMNREILKEILSDELNIIEMDNGQDACDYMMNHSKELSIVILDLIMPGMDGFEVLKFMKFKHLIDDLPVVMISADSDGTNIERAFDLGVIDFLSRPFSERIVKRRILTTIRLFKRQKELVEELDRQYKADDMRIDDLTGLDYKQTYFNKVYTHLKGNPNDRLLMIAIDIDHFKLFNNYYGWEKGDEYLKLIAKYLKEFAQRYGGLAGYLGGDDFALVCPYKRAELITYFDMVANDPQVKDYEVGFSPKIGICEITNPNESVAALYDHAILALESTKGDYSKQIAWYDAAMVQDVKDEYELLVDIQRGIRSQEFIFYIQPKVDMVSGRIVGGEALVRWLHKDKGLISPMVFIPVLEKNGFISQLDEYVWESVASWLSDRIQKGYKPLPISINVSRADIFTMDVTGFLMKLVKKYDLPNNLLEVEITESAYVDETEKMREEIQSLRDAGFTVLMDDFGSGYSSLNSLKDLSIDILKIDMKFLHMDITTVNKGVSILESIVNMARSLHMPTIVEGVETKDQVDFLVKMGCKYAQGYYFYRPVPIEEFEYLLGDELKVDHEGIKLSNIDPVHVREFLDENIFSEVLINNILGPVCFVEMVDDGEIKLIRMNEQFAKYCGYSAENIKSLADEYHLNLIDNEEGRVILQGAMDNPMEGFTGEVTFQRLDGTKAAATLKVFYLRERPGVKVFYASGISIKEQ